MKNIDRVVSVAFILIGLIFFLDTMNLPEGSQSYPRFMIGIMVFLAILLFIKSLISKKSQETWSSLFGHIEWKRFLSVFILSLLYIVVINMLGFFAATFIYLFVLMYVLKASKLVMAISIPSFIIVLFLIFRMFLKVPLPSGILL